MPSTEASRSASGVLPGDEGLGDGRMADGVRHLSGLLDQVYEPVQGGLGRVKESLRGLAKDRPAFLAELLEYVLETKGKRIRPALTLLASMFHPNDGRNAEIMAAAVELLHIASLIHDDTVDNSDTRRGRATISSLWGGNAAVLLGDYVFATSATYVCDTDNVRVIRRFSETIMELASGELTEMAGAYDPGQSREQYLQRIYNKTGSLFTTAAEAGAVLSGGPESTVRAFKEFGYNIGMAFQIIDDILDFDGSREEIGKPVGNDLSQGVLTLPAIMVIERYPEDGSVQSLFRKPSDADSLRRVLDVVGGSSIMEDSYGVANKYCEKALGCLKGLEPNPARDALEKLVSYVAKRRS